MMTTNKTLVKQNTAAPSRKQNFNLLGSQLTTVGMVMFAIFAPTVYARIPENYEAGFGAAIAGLVGFGLGYLVQERA